MLICPCCPAELLRHARAGKAYFFCPNCRTEVPDDLNINGTSLDEVGMNHYLAASIAERIIEVENTEQLPLCTR